MTVPIHWRDVQPHEAPTIWAGLELTVPQAPRPALRIEATTGRRIRLMAAEAPVLWARIAAKREGFWWLRPHAARAAVLPPISSADVRQITAPPRSPRWYAAWARRFASGLAASALSPLHAGVWELTAGYWPGNSEPVPTGTRPVALYRATQTAEDAQLGYEDWGLNGSAGVLPLRLASPEHSGRIKAQRKLVRSGQLPPLLLWYVSGLDMYLLLDGHDRLKAAQLEGQLPPALALSAQQTLTFAANEDAQAAAVRNVSRALSNTERPQRLTMKRLNDSLIRAFTPSEYTLARSRAYALPGGAARWLAEVSARLNVLGSTDETRADWVD